MRGNFVESHTLPIRAEYELLRNSHAISQHDSRAQGFSPPLARRRSSCSPPSPNLVRTNPIEHYQVLRDRAPCPSRAATLPKGTKLELGRGTHLGTPSSGNHTAAASHPTGRIAKAASWLHLSRVSPALHPPERPSHTLAPKQRFRRDRARGIALQSAVFRCAIAVSPDAAATAALHRLVCVYGYDFSGGCNYPRF